MFQFIARLKILQQNLAQLSDETGMKARACIWSTPLHENNYPLNNFQQITTATVYSSIIESTQLGTQKFL